MVMNKEEWKILGISLLVGIIIIIFWIIISFIFITSNFQPDTFSPVDPKNIVVTLL